MRRGFFIVVEPSDQFAARERERGVARLRDAWTWLMRPAERKRCFGFERAKRVERRAFRRIVDGDELDAARRLAARTRCARRA